MAAPAPARAVRLAASGKLEVGKRAPPFGGFDLEEKTVLAFDPLLKKVAPAALLIHVGASWCEHCCPGLQAIRRIEGRNPGAVRLVFIDVEPDVKKGRAFRDQCVPGALALLDRFEVIAKSLGASEPRDGGPGLLSIPLTILVDARGIVRTIVKGQFPDLEALLEEDLRALPSRDAAPDGGPADAGR